MRSRRPSLATGLATGLAALVVAQPMFAVRAVAQDAKPAVAFTVAAPSPSPSGATTPGERAAAASKVDPAAARAFLATVKLDAELQAFLERSVAAIGAADPRFLASSPRIAVIDLGAPASPAGAAAPASPAPRLAAVRGDEKVYPASVVKFVYLMAAYAWREQGRLEIDSQLDAELTGMIRESSNGDTQKVFAKLTGTAPGPDLDPAAYAQFRSRRLLVKDWLATLGITDLHAVNPTYDGGGDLFGRDVQFLRDRSVPGGLDARGSEYPNRQAMTAEGTAKLLALLAMDLALTPSDSATVRRRMKRDVREQPHLVHRIAGGVDGMAGVEVYAKSGTWGPIYADAGIVHQQGGKQFALAVFTDASPPYRGDAIAQLSKRVAEHLFPAAPSR